MSKTNKTRPLYVRLSDHNDKRVGVKEVHDHRSTACDLPQLDNKTIYKHSMVKHSTNCYYDFKYVGSNPHGCKACTDQLSRKRNAKNVRHRNKQTLRKIKHNEKDSEDTFLLSKYRKNF